MQGNNMDTFVEKNKVNNRLWWGKGEYNSIGGGRGGEGTIKGGVLWYG